MENLSELNCKELMGTNGGGAKPGPAFAWGALHVMVDFYNGFMDGFK
ncbi:hypothetical protein [Flagellimonas baculiformis]|nr:hypothetical protein [Muricauda sp. D6]